MTVTGEPLPGKSAPPLAGRAARQRRHCRRSRSSRSTRRCPASTRCSASRSRSSARARFARARRVSRLQADLAKVPWFSATGAVTGRRATGVRHLCLAGRGFFGERVATSRARGIALSAVTARGRLDWPRLQIPEGSIVGGDGRATGLARGMGYSREGSSRCVGRRPDPPPVTRALAAEAAGVRRRQTQRARREARLRRCNIAGTARSRRT